MAKRILLVAALSLAGLVAPTALGQEPTRPTRPTESPAQTNVGAATGDAKRGKELFDTTYRCYACHGFDAQTGTPRLVPMTRTQEAFVAYLRKPATPGMPKFPVVPEQDLSDIYAYIRSIPAAAPPLEAIPLLKDVLDRRAK